MVNDQTIQPPPAIIRQFDCLFRKAKVRHIARKHLDPLRAILVVQLIQGFMGARDEHQFVAAREEVVCNCLPDSCKQSAG